MTIFMLIIFGLATFRTIVPMAKKEKVTFINVIFAIAHIVAYVHLLKYFVSLNTL